MTLHILHIRHITSSWDLRHEILLRFEMRVLDLLRGVILDALARFEMLLLSQMLLLLRCS